MDFFKSVFSDDPDPSLPRSDPESPDPQSPETLNHASPNSASAAEGGWSFGGLIKTFASKSESVLETYRRDLQEFSTGLKKETQVLRDVVKDLPSSLEVGASKAQGSLESVGQAIDSIGSVVWKSTADIIAHGKDSLLAADLDCDTSDITSNYSAASLSAGRYSRFDAQLRAIQCDLNTYAEEPDDVSDFEKWKSGFNLGEKSEEMENLLRENGVMDGIYKRVVPNTVGHEVFWCRYYYRVHRLEQAEFVRAKLVKRAISIQDEDEELSWDVEDDAEEEVNALASNMDSASLKGDKGKSLENNGSSKQMEKTSVEESRHGNKDEVTRDVEGGEKGGIVEPARDKASSEIVQVEEKSEASKVESPKKTADEKVPSEGKTEQHSESGKDSDISVVSSQPSHEDDDLGWDEIEDIGSDDEKKVKQIGSPNRAELRKRLSVAEDDEDLSWDIEDDDEPIKS